MDSSTTEITDQETPIEEQWESAPIQIGGQTFDLLKGAVASGRRKGKLAIFIKIDLANENFLHTIREAVGVENYDREVAAMIRGWCNDATHDTIAASPTGEFTDDDWQKAFLQQSQPSSRRKSTGIKLLRKKKEDIFEVLNGLVLKKVMGQELDETENNQFLSLSTDYADICEKIEGASRKGKKAKKAKV